MKRIVLVAIGAKFIHSSLALKYLSKFEHNDQKHQLVLAEYTINQRADFILTELYRAQPEVLMFSCYIWNIDLVSQLAAALRKILPHTLLVLGGPEVSYDSQAYLRAHPAVDMIMRGEGELTFSELADYFDGSGRDLADIKGLTYRQGDEICQTAAREPLDLARLPFPYQDDCLDALDKIIYYESSRGCPYNCAYCLSSVEKGVRFVPLEKVFVDLQRFLDARVRQVKFVDRTFNCNKRHTMAVWQYLAAHDNGVTNFHFELTADLLDDELIAFLATLRKGLFQFEIGVQSTNLETITAIRRNVNFVKLADIVRRVKAGGNIHQHLDLIAGLPHEDYASFGRSFDDVYALAPEQLQLGFLKVLEGTLVHHQAAELGIIYHDEAPYEVLCTNDLPYGDLVRLKFIEEMVEIYYNSGKFLHTLDYVVPFFASPFGFYEALAQYWVAGHYQYEHHQKQALCDILHDFCQSDTELDLERFGWLLKFDLCLHEKPRKLPQWLTEDYYSTYRSRIIAFYQNKAQMAHYLPQYQDTDSKVIARQSHLEVFPFDVAGTGQAGRQAILFDYDHKDFLGNATYYVVTLEA